MPESVAAPAAATASSEPTIDPGVDVETATAQADASDAETTETATAEKPAEAKPPEKRKLKLSDTEEIDEEEAIKSLRKRKELDRAAFKKFEEAASIRKEIDARLAALKQDPWGALEKAGIDPVKAAYARLQQELEAAQMSPEQRAMAEREQTLNQRESEIKTWQEQQKAAEHEKVSQKFEQEMIGSMTAALDKSGLPKHPFTLALMNQHALAQYKSGIEDPDFEYAASDAHDLAKDFARSWLGTLAKNPQALIKEFPEVEKAIREFHLASARKAPQGKPAAAAPVKNGKQEEPINLNDMVRTLMTRQSA